MFKRVPWLPYFIPILAFMAILFVYPLMAGLVTSFKPERLVEIEIPDGYSIEARRGRIVEEGGLVAINEESGEQILAPETGRVSRGRRLGINYVFIEYRAWGLDNYSFFFSDPHNLEVLRFTAIDLGVFVTAAALLVGIPLAYKLRRPFAGVTTLRAIVTLPMAYAGLIAVTLIFIFFSGSGLFNRFLISIGLIDEPMRLMGNYVGLLFASVYQQTPFIFLFLISAMIGISPSVEEAARTLGASPFQVFRKVAVPLIMPAIITVAVLGYIQNYGAFVTAIIAGDPFQNETILISAYEAYQRDVNFSRATTIAYIAGATEMIFIMLYVLFLRRYETGR